MVIEKGGDVIPRVVAPVLEPAAGRRRAVGDADDVPGVRERAAPRRRGGRLALREHLVPGAPAPQPRALRVALGDEHRRARRVARRSADRAGARPRLRGSLSPRGRRSSKRWSSTPREPQVGARRAAQARQGRPQRRRADRAQQGERPLAADLRAWASATSARRRPRRSRATCGRWSAMLDAPVEALQVGARDRAGRRRVGARVRRRAAQPRARRRAWRRPASTWRARRRSRHDDVGPLAGKTFVLTGTLASHDARGGDRGARAARRDASPGRSARRRRYRRGRRRSGQQAREGAGRSASRRSMRTRFWLL